MCRILGEFRKVLAARAGEKIKRKHFQSGGTVTALLSFALKTDVVNAAALTDRKGLIPIPRLITHWEDVPRCAGTKFMASPTLSSVNTAMREGHQRIGLVGTPCQIVAAAQMSANPMEKEEYTVPLSEIKPLIPHTCFICLDMTAELAALVNASHYQSDITLVVLDNSGTAMTGFQPHPGLPVDAGSAISGENPYPDMDQIQAWLEELTADFWMIAATENALELGNPILSNIILIGAVAGLGVLPLDRGDFEAAILRTVSHDMLELNLKAYDLGYRMVE